MDVAGALDWWRKIWCGELIDDAIVDNARTKHRPVDTEVTVYELARAGMCRVAVVCPKDQHGHPKRLDVPRELDDRVLRLFGHYKHLHPRHLTRDFRDLTTGGVIPGVFCICRLKGVPNSNACDEAALP